MIKPEDILADEESFVELKGVNIRKGSIAAFLKNIDIFEDAQLSAQEKAAAFDMMKQLAPAIVASGLHKHAVFKNKAIQEILNHAKNQDVGRVFHE